MILINNLRFIRRGGFKTKNFLTPICLLILFTIIACSPTTEISKGNLSGVIALEGMEDNSAIIVAIYDLAYLDTTIVRINNEYPQIGVKITQHTEFDHRMQSPIKITETIADGFFELSKIPTGTYNLVAMKADYGFKYLYEIEITEGDNEISQARCHPESFVKLRTGLIEGRSEISELTPQPAPPRRINLLSTIEGKPNNDGVILHAGAYPAEAGEDWTNLSRSSLKEGSQPTTHNSQLTNRTSDLTLFPEHHISGNILDDVIVLPWHHLIIDNDTYFVPGSLLTLMANSIVRINPGCDLKIYGKITAQGEENNMFWITSNDGFDSSLLLTSYSPREEILLYNSMELSSIASVSNDLIQWGKWDFAMYCLNDALSNSTLKNIIMRNSISGFQCESSESINIHRMLLKNITSEVFAGLKLKIVQISNISENLLFDCEIGILLDINLNSLIENNLFLKNSIGLSIMGFKGIVRYNEFDKNILSDIKMSGADGSSIIPLQILNNEFSSQTAIYHYRIPNLNYTLMPTLNVNYNNFRYQGLYFNFTANIIDETIDFRYNCYNELANIDIITSGFNNRFAGGLEMVIFEPFETNFWIDAGID